MIKSDNSKPKILIAPLNWGLGHASRCIPIIKAFLNSNHEVIIACGELQKNLLVAEFPALRYIDLPGYDLRYGKNRTLTLIKIIFQIPKILIRIKMENRWLKGFLAEEKVDAVISDNRYGLFSAEILSVFVTHQLGIKAPFGVKMERLIQKINYKYINRFSACWIPDFEKEPSLAGDLSHPTELPATNIRYIGCLSRFQKINAKINENSLLVILSGPEPQRTIFEKILQDQLLLYTGSVIMVRGLPGKKDGLKIGQNLTVYNHLPTTELNVIVAESAFVICRSGYSSIMDMVRLGKKSIVVPTPGQTEQEYLAHYLFRKNIVFSADQRNFLLSDVLSEAKRFSYQTVGDVDDSLSVRAVEELSASFRK
jgi:UDP:flavonoid glycosyltransferase YjiC (YdhE family)